MDLGRVAFAKRESRARLSFEPATRFVANVVCKCHLTRVWSRSRGREGQGGGGSGETGRWQ